MLIVDIFHFHVGLRGTVTNMLGEKLLVTTFKYDDVWVRQMRVGIAVCNTIQFTQMASHCWTSENTKLAVKHAQAFGFTTKTVSSHKVVFKVFLRHEVYRTFNMASIEFVFEPTIDNNHFIKLVFVVAGEYFFELIGFDSRE